MNSDVLLRVRLSAGYRDKEVLNDLRFEVQRGEVLGLVGTSGAGKSTLVWSLLGLLPWRSGNASGEVLLDGVDLLARPERELRKIRGRKVALIPQSPMTALNSAISLQRHFDEAWRAHERGGISELKDRIATLMAEVQLPCDVGFLRRRPGQISVGQAQRVLIALALLHRPVLIVADEPTSALDPVTQIQIIGLLRKLNRTHGTGLLYISHDLVSVLQLSDRVAVLDAGTIVENLPVTELGRACHPATVALLNALPVPADVLLAHRLSAQVEADPLIASA
jgi:ABC-type glutathione transport system ATPase component